MGVCSKGTFVTGCIIISKLHRESELRELLTIIDVFVPSLQQRAAPTIDILRK